ncbi:DUF1652 domain-containing protein [Pseudomonas sp. 21LCFQ02]|uniref:DUF1652 domain-containing protein n=1 Tax=unclassified Pseudomonas TaxID=196821 RepID=UPI0004F8918F|nr:MULTISPECIES: DUF1652 domain-containing protein [unclassified Pseudomonas]MCO8164459.1 DUF1652 domain-containing protein [Pseudomonas sp. 21LCFQ010]MCO8171313.1 DUF1652 domain-containing protein [Pseudomonas sp. 21LCFQ02]BAP40846.1 putative uncharacterized protein [Pseudomonas sp. StFLB209]
MFSHNELRHILEKAFAPTPCRCTISQEGTITLELLNPESHARELLVPGIPVASLTGGRDLAALVRDVKERASRRHAAAADPVKRQG